MDEMGDNNSMEREDELERLVKDTEAINLIFNEPMNLLRDLIDSFESKNYAAMIENGRKALFMADKPLHQFIKVGMAFSISAAMEWLSTLAEAGVDITAAEDVISRARDQFISGDFQKANEDIGKVNDMIPTLLAEQMRVAKDGISSAEQLIEINKNMGATVNGAEQALQQAKNFLDEENYLEVAKSTKEAKEQVEAARQQRIQTISDSLLFTRSIIDESKDIGVNTSEPEALHEEAKAAFAAEDYNKCSELNKTTEEMALRLQEEHIKKVLALKDRRESMKGKRPIPERPPQLPESYVAPTGEETEEEPTDSEPTAEEETPSEKTPEEASDDICPTCDTKMRYIEKYSRYWCNKCQKYAPKH